MILYHLKYWHYTSRGVDTSAITKERFAGYIRFEDFITLLNILTIYSAFIITEAYRYVALLYINKMGYISKVTIYSALHGFMVIILYMIFFEVSTFDYVFAVVVTFAYLCVYCSKFFHTRAAKHSNKGKTLKFKRILLHNDEVTLHQSISELTVSKYYFSENGDQESDENSVSHSAMSGFGEKENRLKMSDRSHTSNNSLQKRRNMNNYKAGGDDNLVLSINEIHGQDLSRTQKSMQKDNEKSKSVFNESSINS